MTSPKLLVVDEPFAGLDLAGREQLIAWFDSLPRDMAVVLVTHHLEEIPTSWTHAAVLAASTLRTAGALHEVLTSEIISSAFEIDVTVTQRRHRWFAEPCGGSPSASN